MFGSVDEVCSPRPDGGDHPVDLGARHECDDVTAQRGGEGTRTTQQLQADLLRRCLCMFDVDPNIGALGHSTFASSFKNARITATACSVSPSTIRPAFRAGGGDRRTRAVLAAATPTPAPLSPRSSAGT